MSQGVEAMHGDKFRAVHEAHKINLLTSAYMTHGHLLADLDPLQLFKTYITEASTLTNKYKLPPQNLTKLIDYKSYGFTEADLEREFYVDSPELGGILGKKKNWKLGDLINAYHNAYCKKIGVEYMHIADRDRCNYIRETFESF